VIVLIPVVVHANQPGSKRTYDSSNVGVAHADQSVVKRTYDSSNVGAARADQSA
jgi:hypothetical protein